MDVELIQPRASGRFDFDTYVLDSDDVAHVLNPANQLHALCGRRWNSPWWQDRWEPDNYPRCETCHTVRSAVTNAQRSAGGDEQLWTAPAWRVLDSDDDRGLVHLLNPVATTQALCGWTWGHVVAEGSAWVSGDPCETCQLARAAGLGARPDTRRAATSAPAASTRQKRPATNNTKRGHVKGTSAAAPGQEPAVRRAKRAQTLARRSKGTLGELARRERDAAKRMRAAERADRASSRSQRGTSVRAMSGGLPSLGRRR